MSECMHAIAPLLNSKLAKGRTTCPSIEVLFHRLGASGCSNALLVDIASVIPDAE